MSINSNLVAGSKKIISEASLFSPTSLVTFYELDFRTFGINRDDIDLAELTFKDNLTLFFNHKQTVSLLFIFHIFHFFLNDCKTVSF